MNQDVFAGKWKQVQGEAKVWWGKLTDDDVDKVAGRFDMLVGLIQEKYGYSHEQAQKEIQKRLMDFEVNMNRKTQPRQRAA